VTVRKTGDKNEKEKIAGSILSDLPEWFGLPESTLNYIKESQEMSFWLVSQAKSTQN
jgi:hypothetical protein